MRRNAAKTEFLPHELFFTSANLTSPHRDLESLYEIPSLLHHLYPFRQTVMSVDSLIRPNLNDTLRSTGILFIGQRGRKTRDRSSAQPQAVPYNYYHYYPTYSPCDETIPPDTD